MTLARIKREGGSLVLFLLAATGVLGAAAAYDAGAFALFAILGLLAVLALAIEERYLRRTADDDGDDDPEPPERVRGVVHIPHDMRADGDGDAYLEAALDRGRPADSCECADCTCPLHTYPGDDACIWCRNGDHAGDAR